MNDQEAKGASGEQNEPSAVLERLSWQLARRDDKRVAQALYAGEELEEIHDTLVKQGYWTNFLCFWRKSG
jgi:hypothetical protein